MNIVSPLSEYYNIIKPISVSNFAVGFLYYYIIILINSRFCKILKVYYYGLKAEKEDISGILACCYSYHAPSRVKAVDPSALCTYTRNEALYTVLLKFPTKSTNAIPRNRICLLNRWQEPAT